MNEKMSETTLKANNVIDNKHREINDYWATQKYTQSIVAIIDVMGIKDMFLSTPQNFSSHSVIYKSWDTILKVQQIKEYQTDIQQKYGEWEVNSTILSDSIVLSIATTIPNAFTKISLMVGLFCNSLFLLDIPYFTRGAMVIGDIYHKDNIVFGPALVKAHLLEKDNAKNFRIIIDKDDFSVVARYIQNDFELLTKTFFYADGEFYCYDYLLRFLYYADNRVTRNNDNPQTYIAALERMKRKIEYQALNHANEGVRGKYIWMKEYFSLTLKKALKESSSDDFVWLRNALKK